MEISPWLVMLLGMGTVFVGLTVVILLTQLMGVLFRPKPAPAVQPKLQTVPAAAAQPAGPIADRGSFDAAVAAAIVAYAGMEAPGLRIHSIKQVGAAPEGKADHAQFSAAIAAAIATTIGTNVSGLRIRNIRKI